MIITMDCIFRLVDDEEWRNGWMAEWLHHWISMIWIEHFNSWINIQWWKWYDKMIDIIMTWWISMSTFISIILSYDMWIEMPGSRAARRLAPTSATPTATAPVPCPRALWWASWEWRRRRRCRWITTDGTRRGEDPAFLGRSAEIFQMFCWIFMDFYEQIGKWAKLSDIFSNFQFWCFAGFSLTNWELADIGRF